MDNLNVWKEEYPFNDIKIKTPKALQGGTYCAKLELNEEPIIIQTPKCKTKNGIHRTAKQIYCDLLLTQDNSDFIDWLSDFQERVRDLIIEKSDNWFHEPISLDEIEYNWNDSIRTYKGKNYLIRSFVHKNKRLNKIGLQIYDSDENEVSLDDVDSNKDVICILEIVGLKFSSQSFSLEICLRQMMVMNTKPIFNKCLIKTEKRKNKVIENTKLDLKDETTEDKDEEKIDNDNKDSSQQKLQEENDKTNTDVVEVETNQNNLDNINTSSKEIDNVVNKSANETNIDDSPSVEEELKKEKKDNVDTNILDNIVDNKSIEDLENKKNLGTEEVTLKNNIDKSLEKSDSLEEIELNVDDSDTINIKEPNEVYLDIYKAAKQKAKAMKNEAIKAYLEAKRIKELYMLDIVDSSEEDDEEEEELFSEN